MPHILARPESYGGRSFPNGQGHTECVELIKQTLSAPATSAWREGAKVVKLGPRAADTLAKGTAIATVVAGKYPQHGNTGMHAAIYMGQNAMGIHGAFFNGVLRAACFCARFRGIRTDLDSAMMEVPSR